MTKLLAAWKWIVNNLGTLLDGLFKIAHIILLIMAGKILLKACESDIVSEISLIDKDPITKEVKIGTVRLKKTQPPPPAKPPKLHMLSFQYSSRHDKTIMYGRKITDWGGIDVWAQGGLTADRAGTLGFYVGITLHF